jgi:hypothetical protein
MGDRVKALNEENFQAAATLGEALIHKHHDISQKDWEAAVAVIKEMLVEKMTMLSLTRHGNQNQKSIPYLSKSPFKSLWLSFAFPKHDLGILATRLLKNFCPRYIPDRSTGEVSH